MSAPAYRLVSIPTRELRLLLKNADANGFDSAPHAEAYRVELENRNVLCVNCGEFYSRPTPCFKHCDRCIPLVDALGINSPEDLREYQRRAGADV